MCCVGRDLKEQMHGTCAQLTELCPSCRSVVSFKERPPECLDLRYCHPNVGSAFGTVESSRDIP